MQLTIHGDDYASDAWLGDFVRTTVVFATWHYEVPEAVHVRLAEGPGRHGPYVCCAIEVERPGLGPVASAATGRDPCEAVQRAADRLEVVLHRLQPDVALDAAWPVEERLAA